MTISTLDKWMEEEPESSKYTHIFINVNELNYEFGSRDKVVNYEKLLKWVKKMYGFYFKPILYMGVYDEQCISPKHRKEQEAKVLQI
jgi:hypothetical protein